MRQPRQWLFALWALRELVWRSAFSRAARLSALVAAGALAGSVFASVSWSQATGDEPQREAAGEAAAAEEVEDKRTRRTRTKKLPDGRLVMESFAGSIHFKDEDGEWQPIDNELVEAEGDSYAFRNKANDYKLKLPGGLENAPVRVSEGDSWVTYQLKDAKAHGDKGNGEGQESQALYRNALPHVDVAYRAASDAVKEELILQNRNAQDEFRFRLETSPDLTPTEREGGAIGFVNEDDETVMSFEAPFMKDSSGSDDGFSNEVSLELDRDDSAWTLVLRADRDFLDDEDRTYPVVIDPTMKFREGSVKDCYIKSGDAANTSFCRDSQLIAGVNNNVRHTLVDFDAAAGLDPNIHVLSAELKLHKAGSNQPAASRFGVFPLAADWDASDVTWNNREPGNSWIRPGGDIGPVADQEGEEDSGNTYWYPTAAVQDWADGTTKDYGLLVAKMSAADGDLLTLHSSESSNVDNWPQLKVNYTDRIGMLDSYQFPSEQLWDRMQLHVNLASGNLVLEADDLSLPGVAGHDLGLARFYNSRFRGNGHFGKGWSSSMGYDVRLEPQADRSVGFFGPSGYVTRFERKPDGTFARPDGIDAKLVREADESYLLQFDKSGVRYLFTKNGLLTSVKDQHNNTISLTYRELDSPTPKLDTITDSQGRRVSFAHNGRFITGMTDQAGGRSYGYGYDAEDRLTGYTDPDGGSTTFGYEGDNVTSITDPRGNRTTISYDNQDRVKSITRASNNGGPTTEFDYDSQRTDCPQDAPQGVILKDPRGNKTTYCGDTRDRVRRVIDAKGHKQDVSWRPGARSNPAYTESGAEGPTPHRTTYTYTNDELENLDTISAPDSDDVKIKYEEDQHPHSPTSVTNANGTTWKYEYGGPTANPKPPGNLTRIQNAKSATPEVTLDYDSRGNVIKSTDGRGNSTTYTYTGNLLTKVTPPAPLGTEEFTYDAVGRMKTAKDGKGQVTTFSYDPMDRLTRQSFSDGSSVTYFYDRTGNVYRRDDRTGTTTWGIDTLNRPDVETKPTGKNQYRYDGNDNLVQVINDGRTTSYTYDITDELETMTEPGGHQTAFRSDNEGNRTRTTYPNGVVIQNTYDGKHRLKSTTATAPNGAVLTRFSYNYSFSGKKTDLRHSVTDKWDRTTAYRYDDLERLISADFKEANGSMITDWDYTYDRASNRTSQTANGNITTYTYNAANQLTNDSAGRTYSYDLNGNETLRNPEGRKYAYNANNQTTKITRPGLIEQVTDFTYADAGQTERTRAGDKAFHSDARGVIVEGTAVAGQPVPGEADSIYYNRDPGGTLVGQRNGLTNERHYFLFDGLGSVVGLTDQNGALVRYREYNAYGQAIHTSGTSGKDSPWQYTSQYLDAPTGLYKMGARYYDPAIARWSQQDPLSQVADPRQANRYGYAAGDPVNNTDPTGLVTRPSIGCNIGAAVRPLGGGRLGFRVEALCGSRTLWVKVRLGVRKHVPGDFDTNTVTSELRNPHRRRDFAAQSTNPGEECEPGQIYWVWAIIYFSVNQPYMDKAHVTSNRVRCR